jgi:hypothetical protein
MSRRMDLKIGGYLPHEVESQYANKRSEEGVLELIEGALVITDSNRACIDRMLTC